MHNEHCINNQTYWFPNRNAYTITTPALILTLTLNLTLTLAQTSNPYSSPNSDPDPNPNRRYNTLKYGIPPYPLPEFQPQT